MKKIFLLILLSVAVLTGCKKDDNLIDGKTPEERTTAALTKYKDILTGSQYGWKAYLYPEGGGGFAFYLNFTKENRVSMYADLGPDESKVSKESSYSLKAQQTTLLSFDTYNYMHILADPEASVFGGDPGWGVYSDFEFSFDQESGDTLTLKGKLLGSKLVLVKATQAEKESYDNEGLFNSISNTIGYVDENPNLFISLGDNTKINTKFDYDSKEFSLVWLGANGEVVSVKTAFVFTLTGILLEEPLDYNGKKITEFIWDPVKMVYYTTIDGTRVEINISPTPTIPLHVLMGTAYTYITIPNVTTYPGWGTDFVTRRAAAATGVGTFSLSGVQLKLNLMEFDFDDVDKKLTVYVLTTYGSNNLVLSYTYSYTKTIDGVYKFTLIGPTDGNSNALMGVLNPILAQRIGTDNFNLDYFQHPTTGAILGQFKSVENPGFTFTGALQ